MYLYHGTKESYGKQIIQEGIIKSNIKRNYDEHFVSDFRTTDGYVYLTNNLSKASYYGNKNCFIFNEQEPEDYFYVFRIEIEEEELLPDKDELKAYNLNIESDLETSLNCCMSVVVNHDIDLKQYKVYYAKVPSAVCRKNDKGLKFMHEFISLFQIEGRRNLNDYQVNYIKESYEQFEILFQWIRI